jgi:hypothetical protein
MLGCYDNGKNEVPRLIIFIVWYYIVVEIKGWLGDPAMSTIDKSFIQTYT